jgi:hypothetical protein
MKLLMMSSNALKITEGTDTTCGRFFASAANGDLLASGVAADVAEDLFDDVVVVVVVGVVVFAFGIWAFSSIPTEDTLRIGEL